MPTLVEAWESHADDRAEWARRPGRDSYWRFHRDSFMSLHDMDDMPAAGAEVGRVLRPGGHLCFAVMHPLNASGEFTAGDHAPFEIAGDYFQPRRGAFAQAKAALRWERVPLFLDVRAVRR